MSFIPNVLKRRESKDRQHRENFAKLLRERIEKFQARLKEEDFEGKEDEAVHLTQHVQRLRRILDELEAANNQGQGKQTAAM